MEYTNQGEKETERYWGGRIATLLHRDFFGFLVSWGGRASEMAEMTVFSLVMPEPAGNVARSPKEMGETMRKRYGPIRRPDARFVTGFMAILAWPFAGQVMATPIVDQAYNHSNGVGSV